MSKKNRKNYFFLTSLESTTFRAHKAGGIQPIFANIESYNAIHDNI